MNTTPPPSLLKDGPWWRELTSYHWFVFAVASMAWLFDCFDQQIFILYRGDALKNLLPAGTDPTEVKKFGGYATSIFVAGWATGGLIFGSMGAAFSSSSDSKSRRNGARLMPTARSRARSWDRIAVSSGKRAGVALRSSG